MNTLLSFEVAKLDAQIERCQRTFNNILYNMGISLALNETTMKIHNLRLKREKVIDAIWAEKRSNS